MGLFRCPHTFGRAVYGNYFLFYIEIRTNRLIYFIKLKPKAIDLFNVSHTVIFLYVSCYNVENVQSRFTLQPPHRWHRTTDRLLLFLKEEKSSDRHQATMGLYLPNDRNAHKTFPSFAPSSPLLLSFITQLSFVGLIRLYLVWVHWGEKHVKGKGRGSGSKVTWFVRLQKYLEKVSDTSATTVASV